MPKSKPIESLRQRRNGSNSTDALNSTSAVATVKKHGRPPKAASAAARAEGEAGDVKEPKRPGRRGRPPKAVAASEAMASPKPRGRMPKDKTVESSTVVPARRRGRPPKAMPAVDLNHVASTSRSSRVTQSSAPKRASPRVKELLRRDRTAATAAAAARPTPAAQTSDPRKTARKPRGRPRKLLGLLNRSDPRSAVGPSIGKTRRVAPRKRRGYTTIDVPDKFANQMKAHLADLMAPGDAGDAGIPVKEVDEIVLATEIAINGDEDEDADADAGAQEGFPASEIDGAIDAVVDGVLDTDPDSRFGAQDGPSTLDVATETVVENALDEDTDAQGRVTVQAEVQEIVEAGGSGIAFTNVASEDEEEDEETKLQKISANCRSVRSAIHAYETSQMVLRAIDAAREQRAAMGPDGSGAANSAHDLGLSM